MLNEHDGLVPRAAASGGTGTRTACHGPRRPARAEPLDLGESRAVSARWVASSHSASAAGIWVNRSAAAGASVQPRRRDQGHLGSRAPSAREPSSHTRDRAARRSQLDGGGGLGAALQHRSWPSETPRRGRWPAGRGRCAAGKKTAARGAPGARPRPRSSARGCRASRSRPVPPRAPRAAGRARPGPRAVARRLRGAPPRRPPSASAARGPGSASPSGVSRALAL